MASLWVIGRNDEPFLLWLDPVTRKEAEQMIRWQHVGGFITEFFICRLVAAMTFECITTGKRLSPVQSFYTDNAWARIKARLTRG